MSLKSPQFFFLALLTAISIAIGATFLLANDKRNLRALLFRFGVELTEEAITPPRSKAARKTGRLSSTVTLPQRLFADFGVPEQTFSRIILTRPEAICDRLKDAGFVNMERQAAFARDGWECSVLQLVGADSGSTEPTSSIFVFIRVDGPEDRVESFRVKINIEKPEQQQQTLALAVRAADVFLRFVRWDSSGEITQRIAGLEEFEVTRFGTRIRMKKEMGDVPRYNFLAAQLPQKKPKRPSDTFFNRDRWLPLADARADIRLPAAFTAGFSATMPLAETQRAPTR